MHRWLGGEVSADAKGLAKLAAHSDVTIDYLISGISSESGDWETGEGATPPGFVRIPIYPIGIGAGGGRAALEADPLHWLMWPEALLRRYGRTEDLKLFPIVGESMEPELQDGGLALINESEKSPRDGIVVARLGDDLLLKRMRLLGGGRAELVSINPAYPPIPVNLMSDDFAVIGKAAMGFKAL
ncbi:hypothetical protein WP12_03365 [Sphingomonas sp. SRS2]|nr:hypothetical protein WP12_03365 [Sphingomonas sp. SRS2]